MKKREEIKKLRQYLPLPDIGNHHICSSPHGTLGGYCQKRPKQTHADTNANPDGCFLRC